MPDDRLPDREPARHIETAENSQGFDLTLTSITAITEQKRNPDRVNIYLDGVFAFGLAREAAAGLKVGDKLSEDRVRSLQDEETFYKAKNGAVSLISYRPRSVAEVRNNLERKGYTEDVIDRVITHLEEVGLLDDTDFAHYWIEQRAAFKPRSKLALRYELRQKGLSRAVIEKAIAPVDEEEMARQAVAQRAYRWESLSHDDYTQKMSRYLQGRGFNYEIIGRVVEEYRPERDHDESP